MRRQLATCCIIARIGQYVLNHTNNSANIFSKPLIICFLIRQKHYIVVRKKVFYLHERTFETPPNFRQLPLTKGHSNKIYAHRNIPYQFILWLFEYRIWRENAIEWPYSIHQLASSQRGHTENLTLLAFVEMCFNWFISFKENFLQLFHHFFMKFMTFCIHFVN